MSEHFGWAENVSGISRSRRLSLVDFVGIDLAIMGSTGQALVIKHLELDLDLVFRTNIDAAPGSITNVSCMNF